MSCRYFRLVAPMLPVTAMALFPFVLFDRHDRASTISLLRHEQIHLRQQIELLILPFYLFVRLLLFERAIQRAFGKGAYRAIPLNARAYLHEASSDYLNSRSPLRLDEIQEIVGSDPFQPTNRTLLPQQASRKATDLHQRKVCEFFLGFIV